MTRDPGSLPGDDVKRLNLNMAINQQHVYRSSVFKDAQYLIQREDFKRSIKDIQKKLGLDKNPSDAHNAWMWALTTTPHTPGENWDEKVKTRYELMQASVYRVIKDFSLTKEWKGFIEGVLLQSSFNDRPWMPLDLKIEFISVSDNEIPIRLKPGLRYEEYRKAWKQIAPILGRGQRLKKPYTSQQEHMEMYKDKVSGMTYTEISKKYYPKNPLQNIEKVKKAILRTKKRLERDK